MNTLLLIFTATLTLEASIVLLLNLMPRLSSLGKDMVGACTKAPGIDLILSAILWLPWVTGGLIAGWLGILATLVAQILVMNLWALIHELVHGKIANRPCIYQFYNRQIGWWRNNTALWATTVVIPVFFLIRFAEIFVYPILVWQLGFPKYNHNEWVNVSRQKFQGLIGYDLIWCLYCDWMTGVYSLGAEMLRNVESFWCPIRFYEDKKCENCQLDFPDIGAGWVAADGTMKDVENLLTQKYSGVQKSWFGHPERREQD